MSAEEERNNTKQDNNSDDDNLSVIGDGERRRYGPPYDHLILNYELKNKYLFIEKRGRKGAAQKSFMKIKKIGEVFTEMKQVRHVIWYSVSAEINDKIINYNFRYGDKASDFVDKLFNLFMEQEEED